MAKSLQIRRGTTSEHNIFTGLSNEITIDTDKKTIITHDGEKAGGYALAREDLSNITDEILTTKGIAKTDLSNVSSETISEKGFAKKDLTNISDEAIFAKNIAKKDLSNITDDAKATEEKAGVVQFATEEEVSIGTEKFKAISPFTIKNISITSTGLPPEHISGFKITKTADKSITISKGMAKSKDGSCDIIIKQAIQKQFDLSWNEGDNTGGFAGELNETLQPNTVYHIFALHNPETKMSDIGFDKDKNATNILRVAGERQYTQCRRIGSVSTDATSNISEDSIAGAGEFKTDWLVVSPSLVTTIVHNLNIPATEQKLKGYVKIITPNNAWNAGDIIDISLSNYEALETYMYELRIKLNIEKNQTLIIHGEHTALFSGAKTGGPGLVERNTCQFLLSIKYPTKYDVD